MRHQRPGMMLTVSLDCVVGTDRNQGFARGKICPCGAWCCAQGRGGGHGPPGARERVRPGHPCMLPSVALQGPLLTLTLTLALLGKLWTVQQTVLRLGPSKGSKGQTCRQHSSFSYSSSLAFVAIFVFMSMSISIRASLSILVPLPKHFCVSTKRQLVFAVAAVRVSFHDPDWHHRACFGHDRRRRTGVQRRRR